MLLHETSQTPPRFIVFEGVDGVGKTTLAELLVRYYEREFSSVPVAAGAFPGTQSGSLGEWVYRLHHGGDEGSISASIAPSALQLLHVAAHVDAISSWITPALERGCVILDRYWWSTYAYSRIHLSPDDAWALVAAEHPFWRPLPRPTVFYVTRTVSLKSDELDGQTHDRLDRHYREVMERECSSSVEVHELVNDGELGDCWRHLLAALGLRHAPI